ncbi:MAG: hypothetical protein WD359_01125 [Dehalococcoidia bacterium]
MRTLTIVFALAALAAVTMQSLSVAHAAGDIDDAPVAAAFQQEVDDNDDTRLEVQLVVLGVAAFVVGIGAAGYVLRKRLGLVPPPPGPDAGGH